MASKIRSSLSKRIQKNIMKKPDLLEIMMLNDKTLDALSFEPERPLSSSPRIRNNMNSIKLTAKSFHVCSLSSPQCLVDHSGFVISTNLLKNQWVNKEIYNDESKYSSYINADILATSKVASRIFLTK